MESKEKIYTAAVIIIGNEILSGRTLDKNTQHIAQKLNEAGVVVREARVIPDCRKAIIETVQKLSAAHDYVFTTGGIGPTHDDITAECVAAAFDAALEENADARAMLVRHYDAGELTEARLKMAQIPVGASLIDNPVSGAPGFNIGNVYVMAGIPSIMQAMLDNILPTLKGGASVLSETLSFVIQESVIAPVLSKVQADHPDLDIGSYPYFKDGQHGVSVVIRGYDQGDIDAAAGKVQGFVNQI